jgi:hypothetical protein
LDIVKVKDKATKTTTEKLKDRLIFTKSECELVGGMPNKPTDQDSYEELMRMEDKEIKFWDRVNKVPNNMTETEWVAIRVDYHERMRIAKLEGIQREKDSLEDIFKHLEVKDLNALINKGELPIDVFIISDIANDGSNMLVSRKWNEPLCPVNDIFKHQDEAIKRDEYYQLAGCETSDGRYEQWLDFVNERKVLTGDTSTVEVAEIETVNIENVTNLLKEKASQVVLTIEEPKKKKVLSEGEDEDEDGEILEDEDGESVRSEEKIQLDDEYDDTKGDMPDGYVVNEIKKVEEPKPEPEDEWPF